MRLTQHGCSDQRAVDTTPVYRIGRGYSAPADISVHIGWSPQLLRRATHQLAQAWKPTAAEALSAGLITEVVPEGDDVEVRARALAASMGGQKRRTREDVERLRLVNADESAALANSFVGDTFLAAMAEQNAKRGNTAASVLFRFARATRGLWRPALRTPLPLEDRRRQVPT